jgi:hypothetical protein
LHFHELDSPLLDVKALLIRYIWVYLGEILGCESPWSEEVSSLSVSIY